MGNNSGQTEGRAVRTARDRYLGVYWLFRGSNVGGVKC
jgi:hypothetical protein